ncbi:MAG: cobalamin-dependent protein [archaeon]
MKTVTLINPPQPNSLDDRLDPPLGLMYIGASLRSQGIDTKIIDLSQVSRSQWKDKIGYADVYGTTIFTTSFYLCKEINQIARQNNPNAIIVAGGPHSASLPNQTISEGDFDYVIRGPGEYALPQLIDSLEKRINIPRIIDAKHRLQIWILYNFPQEIWLTSIHIIEKLMVNLPQQ